MTVSIWFTSQFAYRRLCRFAEESGNLGGGLIPSNGDFFTNSKYGVSLPYNANTTLPSGGSKPSAVAQNSFPPSAFKDIL